MKKEFNSNDINDILKKHLEILKKENITLEEIKFLLKNIPSRQSLKPKDKQLIDEIINLAEKHKQTLLQKIKDNIKSLEAKRKYESSKFNIHTFSRRV